MKHAFKKHIRIYILAVSSLIYSATILIGLFNIQVIGFEKYSVLADSQHWNYYSIRAQRGQILSSDGYTLVTNEIAYLLYAQPPKIEEPKKVAQQVVEILGERILPRYVESDEGGMETSDIEEAKKRAITSLEEKLTLDLQWVALFHKISEQEKKKIEQLSLSGLGFEEEPKRLYPEGTVAAHILGFVGSDFQGGDRGYYGIEGYYDKDLRGRDGAIYEERAANGEPILIGEYKRVPAEQGRNLVLTIDRSIQFMIEEKLKEGVERYGAKSGTVIVMEPHTGAILGLSNFPSFDPSNPFEDEHAPNSNDEQDEEVSKTERRNVSIASTYEPGSVIKPLTIAAALDSGIVTPKTTIEDDGPIMVSGHAVDTWDKKHHGTINMINILELSNNVGAAKVGRMLGVNTLRSYFLKFGLGNLTGVDLEGEDTGVVKDEQSWREIDLLTASFGQGISTTPLQMVTAFSAIVNNGKRMKPYVVSKIIEEDEIISVSPQEVASVVSEETALIMQDMLTKAVEGGESKYYNLKNYTVAGKTGTAQIAEGGEYISNKTNATFIGFLPRTPRFVMLVKLEKPTASIYAAETAVPLWMDITRELVAYFGIPPDK